MKNGVESAADLYFVQATDLEMLSLVESRKLTNAWQAKFTGKKVIKY